jgi:hypothetical protein
MIRSSLLLLNAPTNRNDTLQPLVPMPIHCNFLSGRYPKVAAALVAMSIKFHSHKKRQRKRCQQAHAMAKQPRGKIEKEVEERLQWFVFRCV